MIQSQIDRINIVNHKFKKEFINFGFNANKLTGGYCWHYAIGLFETLKNLGYDNLEIISNGSHAKVYSYDNDKSYDANGYEEGDSINMQKPRFRWKKSASVIKFVRRGWVNKDQLDKFKLLEFFLKNKPKLSAIRELKRLLQ